MCQKNRPRDTDRLLTIIRYDGEEFLLCVNIEFDAVNKIENKNLKSDKRKF